MGEAVNSTERNTMYEYYWRRHLSRGAMKLTTSLLATVVVGALSLQSARAHFLFARILPPAEGGRAVEVYFSELAEAGDARFIDKVAGTKLWLQQTPGQWEPLQVRKTSDRLRAHLPAS